MSATFKMQCGSCGQHIECPNELFGQSIDCPSCGSRILAAESPPPPPSIPQAIPPVAPPPPIAFNPPPPNPEIFVQRIQKRGEFVGAGCFLQTVGLVLIICGFWLIFPIFIGLALIFWGSMIARKYVCPSCGNPLADKYVSMCPVCRCCLRK